MSQKVFFLDTETTSADTTCARVLQFAIITQFLNQSIPGEIGAWHNCEWMVNPHTPIEIGAMATHHITDKMVQNSPGFKESEGFEVLTRRLELGHILVAHNAPYDVRVLANEGVVIDKYIDTLRVARHLLDDPGIESYGLQNLRYFYKLDDLHEGELTSGFAHSALYDTIVLKWFYEFLTEKIHRLFPTRDVVEKMIELTNSPVLIKVFKFGKYKGKQMEDIVKRDPGYFDWLLNSESSKPEHEQNPDMIYSLKYYINS